MKRQFTVEGEKEEGKCRGARARSPRGEMVKGRRRGVKKTPDARDGEKRRKRGREEEALRREEARPNLLRIASAQVLFEEEKCCQESGRAATVDAVVGGEGKERREDSARCQRWGKGKGEGKRRGRR